jgi:putative membrane protein
MSVSSEKSKDGSKVNIPGANSNDRKTIFEFIFNYQDDKEFIIKPNIRKFSVNFLFVGIIPSILFFCLNYFSELLTNLNYIIFQSGYIIIMILVSYRLFKNSYLSVSKNYIKAQSGFWDIKTKIIETHKIQSIVIDQDIWYKKLNLADLTICTAGGMIRFTFINYDVLKKITDNFLYKVEESNKSWM